MTTPPTDHAAIRAELARRVGDELCDDCGGTLEALADDGENTVPCPDCTPRVPEFVTVPHADLAALLADVDRLTEDEAKEQQALVEVI